MPFCTSRQAIYSIYQSILIFLWPIPFNESRLYNQSHSFGFQIPRFHSIITFVLSIQRYTQSMYLFHILLPILIHVYLFMYTPSYTHSYTHSHTHSCAHFIYSSTYTHPYIHSRTHFIYSFTYSFMYTHS